MFVPRSTAYVIVAMLVVAWLLVSSVHLIQPQTSGEVTSPLKGGGGGLGGGIRITVPRMNLSTNFRVPRFEFQLPTLHLPQLKFPSWTFPFWGMSLARGAAAGLVQVLVLDQDQRTGVVLVIHPALAVRGLRIRGQWRRIQLQRLQ